MGLAVLPRLERELREVRDYIVGEGSLEAVAAKFTRMGKRIKKAQAPTKETVTHFYKSGLVKILPRVRICRRL